VKPSQAKTYQTEKRRQEEVRRRAENYKASSSFKQGFTAATPQQLALRVEPWDLNKALARVSGNIGVRGGRRQKLLPMAETAGTENAEIPLTDEEVD
jgi:hypothetical protein